MKKVRKAKKVVVKTPKVKAKVKSKKESIKAKYVEMRGKMKEDLNKKTENSAKTGDSFLYGNIFKPEIETEYPLWYAKGGEHTLCIIPYMAGDKDPDNKIKEGDFTYTLTILVHYGIGINEDNIVCPRTYGDRCPICEYRKELIKNEGEEDLIKALNAKTRCIYNVWVFDNETEINKGVQIWDSSHYLFQRQLVALAKHPRGGGHINFASPFEDGCAVFFERVGENIGTKYVGMKLFPREEILGPEYKEIPEEILDSACCLDQAIELLNYETIKDKFMSGVSASGSDSQEEIIELDSDEEEYEDEEAEEDRDEELEEDMEEDYEETEEDDILDLDEEEGSEEAGCPEGGVIGEDFQTFDSCDECDLYDDCYTENLKIESEAKKSARMKKGKKKRVRK